MKKPLVWIILLNYNRSKDTMECIESIKANSYLNYKILVVDNCSFDNSFEIFSTELKGQDNIKIVRTKENLGYTGGINFGIRNILDENPEYILILNEDTIVTKDFLDELILALENNSQAAAACGTILYEHDKEKIWYASGRMIPWLGLAVHPNKGKKFDFKRRSPEVTSFITGCMVLLRTSLISDIGIEDERFFMSLDDIEFSARITLKGYHLLYVPNSIIYHKALGQEEKPFTYYYSVRNRLLLISIAFKGINGFIARTYFITILFFKMIYWKLKKPALFKAAYIGVIDYYRKNFYKGSGNLFYKRSSDQV